MTTDDRSRRDREYADFVAAVWAPYLRLARLLTGDRHLAEELLQDSLVSLYTHWRRVSATGDPSAYLRRTLVNGNVSGWRRRRRERLVDAVPDYAVPDSAVAGQAGPGDSAFPDPELRAALLALPWHQRAVVVLRHCEDLSEKAVADALGCSVGTVKSQHARALARLRQLLPVSDPEGVSPR
ncbi:SigE family RNA polymerase sigma factor [Hamadaea tsunoensis]|uniref:SigE family RNA polymerase sigma factor n=1 Tax=Hamadaea tsunoensis TaxID=53368 RepID=UPI0005573622|nr:SigE family RNA polymerase sigma factor [Hamadaea tsunoensis]